MINSIFTLANIFTILILAFQPAFSQVVPDDYAYNSFVTDGKSWEYHGRYGAYPGHDERNVDFRIVMDGDTCINETLWKKCWFRNADKNIINLPVTFLREEGHKVFMLPTELGDQELGDDYQGIFDVWLNCPDIEKGIYPILLYDFDMGAGDSLKWPWMMEGESYYDEEHDFWFRLMEITGIDYHTYCGKTHKVLTAFDNEHVDGIGIIGRHGTFFRPFSFFDFICGGSLGNWNFFTAPDVELKKVIESNGQISYDSSEISSIKNINETTDKELHFDGRLITLPSASSGMLCIYNVSGKSIMSKHLTRGHSIDVSALPPGVYCAVLLLEESLQHSLKFIVK